MYYIIYQTTNKVNNKIYVGAHKTQNLDDGYIGSGKMLHRAIEKYGRESFERKVLFICADEYQMYQKEHEIVNEDFVKRTDTYNMKRGGLGGWDHVDNTGRILSESTHKKMSVSAKIRQSGETNSFYGKHHSKASLERIGAASKARAKSQYEQRLANGNHPNSVGSCPKCGKTGQLRAMKRWHFDNCTIQTSV